MIGNESYADLIYDIVKQLSRIADLLQLIVDTDKKTLRMVDVDRASVYSTHLGKTLSTDKQAGEK